MCDVCFLAEFHGMEKKKEIPGTRYFLHFLQREYISYMIYDIPVSP